MVKQLNKFKQSKNNTDTLKQLKKEKEDLLHSIDVLVNELPKNPVASKYILPQIEEKDKRVQSLDKQILGMEDEDRKDKQHADDLGLVVNNIVDFSKVVDHLDNTQKKYFIQSIVDKVYWDGENQTVEIQLFLGGNKKVSQFHTGTSWSRDKTATLLQENNLQPYPRYEDYPENTLGDRIRKQRFLKGLTAKELGQQCGCAKDSIYGYESDTMKPSAHLMRKIIKVLGVDVKYFQDDYYNFVLSSDYTGYLKKWRKENIKRSHDTKKVLGVSYDRYLMWEKGQPMKRGSFEKIKNKLFK